MMLLAGLLSLWLFAGGGFADLNTCHVQGYLFSAPGEESDFRRADSCMGIRHRFADGALHLDSPRVWVTIVPPASPEASGWRTLTYRWGKDVAHIGPDVVPVAFGSVEKG